jgi:hypothetical protein
VKERDTFLDVFSLLLRFIRFERDRGKFCKLGEISERSFRDHLLGYLDYCNRDVLTEGEIGGGRLDISIDGVVIELKVDKSGRSLTEIVRDHKKQLLAYLRAACKRMGIMFTLLLGEESRVPLPVSDLLQTSVESDSSGKVESVLVALFGEANYGVPSSH